MIVLPATRQQRLSRLHPSWNWHLIQRPERDARLSWLWWWLYPKIVNFPKTVTCFRNNWVVSYPGVRSASWESSILTTRPLSHINKERFCYSWQLSRILVTCLVLLIADGGSLSTTSPTNYPGKCLLLLHAFLYYNIADFYIVFKVHYWFGIWKTSCLWVHLFFSLFWETKK